MSSPHDSDSELIVGEAKTPPPEEETFNADESHSKETNAEEPLSEETNAEEVRAEENITEVGDPDVEEPLEKEKEQEVLNSTLEGAHNTVESSSLGETSTTELTTANGEQAGDSSVSKRPRSPIVATGWGDVPETSIGGWNIPSPEPSNSDMPSPKRAKLSPNNTISDSSTDTEERLVYVGKFASDTTSADVEQLFTDYGPVKIEMKRDYAFVCLSSSKATEAVASLDNQGLFQHVVWSELTACRG